MENMEKEMEQEEAGMNPGGNKGVGIILTVALLVVVALVYFLASRPETSSPDSDSVGVAQDGVMVYDISAVPFEFSIKEIRVKEGDRVRINLTTTEGLHDWVVDEFSASTRRLAAGETDFVEFTADQVGIFEYYCSVGTHREMGMVGKLIVE
jgi:cytochrome c oxidase subunit 2